MIRANDKGIAPPPIEELPKPGLVNGRNIVILVGVIAWLAVLMLFVVPQLHRPAAQPVQVPAAPVAAAAGQPVAAGATSNSLAAGVAPKAVPQPQLVIANRVFNLAGTNSGYKYVKLTLAVSFADDKGDFAKANGAALKKLEDAFTADNAGALTAFNDILTTTVSNKTAADLATPQGKEALRQELIGKFNQALAGTSQRVTYVSFDDFVMQ